MIVSFLVAVTGANGFATPALAAPAGYLSQLLASVIRRSRSFFVVIWW